MTPVTRGAELLQPLPEPLPHVDDPVRHGLDAVAPLLVQGRVLDDSVHNSAAVSWRIGVHGADDQGHLGPVMRSVNWVLIFMQLILEVNGIVLVVEHHCQVSSSFVV